MENELEVDVCLREYAEMRAELRQLFTLLNENVKSAVLLLSALATAGAYLKDYHIIYLIPTTVFIFILAGLWQVHAVNCIGCYCAKIATKLRTLTDKQKIVFDWELEDKFGQISRSPTGIVSIGVILTGITVILIVFGGVSYLSYTHSQTWKATGLLIVHLFELTTIGAFYVSQTKLNDKKFRENAIKSV